MGRRFRPLVLAMLLALVASVVASANQAEPAVLPVDVPGTNIVFMNVRVPQPGLTLYETRALIWKRLVEAFAVAEAEGLRIDGSAVQLELGDGDPRILVAGQVVVTVDATHAAINGTTQEGLAAVWAANLARALDRWAEIHGS